MPKMMTESGTKLTAVQSDSSKSAASHVQPLPSSIEPALKTEWTRIIRYLMGQDAWIPEKGTLVETYLLNISIVREAQARMVADGGVITERGTTHPSSTVIARHSGYITKIAPQLGLGREALVAIKPPVKTTKSKPSTWSA